MQFLADRLFSVKALVKDKYRLGPLPGDKEAYQSVARIALPAVAELVFVSLIVSLDTIMVGSFGKNAIASLSLPGQPRMIKLSIFFALNVGITAIVARRKGEGRRDLANGTLRNAILLVLALSVLVGAIMIWTAEPLMRLAGGNTNTPDDAQVLRDAIDYFVIMSAGLPVTVLSMCICAAMRGAGNTRLTFRVNVISHLVHVTFNYLLIGGNLGFPRLGVKGAAVGAVIGFTVGTALSLIAVTQSKDSYLHISFRDSWRPDPGILRGIVRVGCNAMTEQLGMRFGFFIYSRLIYGMGVMAFAAHNICMQLMGLTFNFAEGLSIAATSLVGQNLGAKRSDLSLMYGKIAQRVALVFSLVLASSVALLRYHLAGLFIDPGTADAATVIAISADTLLILSFIQPFQMNSVVLAGCLRGAGDNLYVAGRMMICVSILRPLATYLAVYVLHLDLPMTWLLSLSEMGVRLFFFYKRFESGKWMSKKV